MKLVEQIQNIQNKNPTSLVLVKNGIFFIGIGKDAIFLNEKLGLKLTCIKSNLCKVGFLVKSVEKYIQKLEDIEISFSLYIRSETDELEEIYHFQGKQVEETRNCLNCQECHQRIENEEEILERVKNLGKTN